MSKNAVDDDGEPQRQPHQQQETCPDNDNQKSDEEQPKSLQKKQKQEQLPRIDSIVPVASTRWLALETYHYTDQEGKQRAWDVATRTTKPKSVAESAADDDGPGRTRSTADAVIIIPLLRSRTDPPPSKPETLLVEQYRPPVQRATVEFPAGLVDAGETVERAALRELREETGYVGTVCAVAPGAAGGPGATAGASDSPVSRAVCMSPGLATETVHVVMVQVDLDDPANRGTPKPELDDGEHVTLHRVPLDEGIKTLLDRCPAMPIMGLYLFAVGFQLGAAHQRAAAQAGQTQTPAQAQTQQEE